MCTWVELGIEVYEQTFFRSRETAILLNVQPFPWPFDLWLGGCDAQVDNAMESGLTARGAADNTLQAVADGASDLELARRLYMTIDRFCGTASSGRCTDYGLHQQSEALGVQEAWGPQDGEQSGAEREGYWGARPGIAGAHAYASGDLPHVGRQLLVKASAKSSTSVGGVQAAVRTVDVASQQWTVDNVPINTSGISGTLVPLRMLGTGNIILGGVYVGQVCWM